MTREEAIKYIKSRCIGSSEERDGTQWLEAMWMAIEALQVKTDGDLISRQDAIRLLVEKYKFTTKEAREILAELPSAEPKTETVLCALAGRTCPFLGKEFAWCLTCPHISEEDRGLLKKAISEPKIGECETCKRNADNGGFYDDGRTRCPIQEHYALLKDGYCHLYEPRMRGEEE